MTTTTPASQPTAPGTLDEQREEARQYVHQLRAFYVHAVVFAVSMVIIFITNLSVNMAAGLTGEWSAWWSVWALLGWGVGVAIHGFVVRISRPQGSGPTWEEAQMVKLLS